MSKFNRLSQLICEYILDPHNKKENFLQFLLGVLLEHKCPKQEKFEGRNQVKEINYSSPTILSNSQLFVPKESKVLNISQRLDGNQA